MKNILIAWVISLACLTSSFGLGSENLGVIRVSSFILWAVAIFHILFVWFLFADDIQEKLKARNSFSFISHKILSLVTIIVCAYFGHLFLASVFTVSWVVSSLAYGMSKTEKA